MILGTWTWTCVGIHPGRVEPASPIALTTSRMEALQARRSCASSLDTFTQSFLHRAWPKTRVPDIGSRSALIVVAHVFICIWCIWWYDVYLPHKTVMSWRATHANFPFSHGLGVYFPKNAESGEAIQFKLTTGSVLEKTRVLRELNSGEHSSYI